MTIKFVRLSTPFFTMAGGVTGFLTAIQDVNSRIFPQGVTRYSPENDKYFIMERTLRYSFFGGLIGIFPPVTIPIAWYITNNKLSKITE